MIMTYLNCLSLINIHKYEILNCICIKIKLYISLTSNHTSIFKSLNLFIEGCRGTSVMSDVVVVITPPQVI
ncbi:hypothetical protein HanRHA438_Chr15g0696931 [Helianthus annuus]|nr:hypothetical protein HanRHA438_Chr15g0696931 [Helianthus annuus]